MPRILVSGTRRATAEHLNIVAKGILLYCLFDDEPVIIHGGAKGVDQLADRFARDIGAEVITFNAQWGIHGKAAGPIRNQRMLDEGKPDVLVAFPDKDSKGTRDMIERAKKAGVATEIIELETKEN